MAHPVYNIFNNFLILRQYFFFECLTKPFHCKKCSVADRNGVVRTATRIALAGPRFKSRWTRDFPHPSRPPPKPTQPPIQTVSGLFPVYEVPRVCHTQWPRGLRGMSADASLLGSRLRFPLGALMSVCCE